MISVYQAIVPMFCCGVFICFVLLQGHSDYEPNVYRNLCLKLLVSLIGAMAVYFIIDRIIIPNVFHIENADYMNNYNQWSQKPAKENILKILGFGYSIALKNIPLIDSFVNPIIAPYMSEHLAMRMDTISRVGGNVLLLPISMLFLVHLTIIMRKAIPAKRRFLYILAGSGIPMSIMFLSIAGGAVAPIRSLYALPLAFAFMLFFLIAHYKKKAATVVACIALFIAAHNAQITAQLFYSDYIRYNEDVRLAYDIDRRISQIQPSGENLPVFILGQYRMASRFRANFIQGEVIGYSFFEWNDNNDDIPFKRSLDFMRSLGINYDEPNEEQLEQALLEAEQMPAYPNLDCVKRTKNFIVAKINN